MNRLSLLAILLLVLALVSSCASSRGESADEIIKPGVRIGAFLITSGEAEEMVFLANSRCPANPSTKTEICEVPVGRSVNVGLGANVAGLSGAQLEAHWLRQSYAMTIEGRPVNLRAFGATAMTHPTKGTMRLWNVVIVSDEPGNITIHHSGEIDGQPVDAVTILVFTFPD